MKENAHDAYAVYFKTKRIKEMAAEAVEDGFFEIAYLLIIMNGAQIGFGLAQEENSMDFMEYLIETAENEKWMAAISEALKNSKELRETVDQLGTEIVKAVIRKTKELGLDHNE
jgi:hypothetical protein